jgi:hypothetical protein
MSKRDTYKSKIDADLEIVQARFTEFKAQAKNLAAEDRIRHAKHIEEIEKRAAATKAKLLELGQADGDVWEQLVDGVENSWKVLQSTLEDAVTTFKKD